MDPLIRRSQVWHDFRAVSVKLGPLGARAVEAEDIVGQDDEPWVRFTAMVKKQSRKMLNAKKARTQEHHTSLETCVLFRGKGVGHRNSKSFPGIKDPPKYCTLISRIAATRMSTASLSCGFRSGTSASPGPGNPFENDQSSGLLRSK